MEERDPNVPPNVTPHEDDDREHIAPEAPDAPQPSAPQPTILPEPNDGHH
jgi:hypothetical protein